MTPPGDALEFIEGPAFQAANELVPGLDLAAKDFVSRFPQKLRSLNSALRTFDVSHLGKTYEILTHQKGNNRVHLLAAAEVVNGLGLGPETLKYFIARFPK